jgi:hypothetical protein
LNITSEGAVIIIAIKANDATRNILFCFEVMTAIFIRSISIIYFKTIWNKAMCVKIGVEVQAFVF